VKRLVFLLLVAVLAAGLVAVAVGYASDSGKVYTLAELQQARSAQPAAWVGRTVLVRGQILDVGQGAWGAILPPFRYVCDGPQRGVSLAMSSRIRALLVVPAKGIRLPTSGLVIDETLLTAVLDRVACLPVVGGLVPAPAVEYGSTLRIRFLPKQLCTTAFDPTCPDAVLLRAGP
jgi:hypothetical protein